LKLFLSQLYEWHFGVAADAVVTVTEATDAGAQKRPGIYCCYRAVMIDVIISDQTVLFTVIVTKIFLNI